MSGNTEPGANCVPMPMSVLLANLMSLKKTADSPTADSSFSSADDSDNSFGEPVTKKPSPKTKINNEFFTPTVKSAPKDIKAFVSEKKIIYNDHDKENSSCTWTSNQTHPSKNKQFELSAHKNIISNVYPNSELKKRSVLMPQNNINTRPQNSCVKKTPEGCKVPSNPPKLKSATPKIKSGIRRFTPSSSKLSQKKTPQKPVIQNRDRVRCELFTQNSQKDEPRVPVPRPEPVTQPPVPETPLNRQPMPTLCTATPSYPQGAGNNNNSKITFKTTCIKDKKYMYIKKLGVGGSSDVFKCHLSYLHMEKTKLTKMMATSSIALSHLWKTQSQNKLYFDNNTWSTTEYPLPETFKVVFGNDIFEGLLQALDISTSCEYAVKCVYLATDQELAQGYINEVRLLRELQNSDRVIRLFDYEYDRTKKLLRLVLEVGETDLSSLLKSRGAALAPGPVLHYWEEMLHAVHYIHEHGVIHADLKPANFLLVCGRLKLIDFGIASAIGSNATSVVRAQAAGTFSYISPEALMGGAGGYGASGGGAAPIKISFRSDVWSLGCILYSMVYGRTPFGHYNNLAKLAAIVDPNHKIEYPPVDHLPLSLLAALKWCLTYNARSRPFVRELLAIRYLQPAAGLPQALLDKLQPHVTPQEFALLQSAQVQTIS